jgi:hypothetical protein
MHRITYKISLVLASMLLAGSAMAKELTDAEIKDMISGKTTYLETTSGSATGTAGKGVIYYAADGTVLYKTPMGVMWHGHWAVKDGTNCSNWKEAPNSPCSKYDKEGDSITIINAATGQVRGKIVKIAPGNPENLAP